MIKAVLPCHSVNDASVLKEPRLSVQGGGLLCQREWVSMNNTLQ